MRAEVCAELGEDAWRWVRRQVREDDGPWLPDAVPTRPADAALTDDADAGAAPPSDRDCLYCGIAGLAPLLAELALHRALDDDEQALRAGTVERLHREAAGRTDVSLFDGSGGDAVALRLLAPGTEGVALQRIDRAAIERTEVTDVVGGLAGAVLAAVWAGGPHGERVAAAGSQALLHVADRTPAGLDWAMRPGYPSRMPNFSHGTAGVATALAVAGVALGRGHLVDAAIEGARHVLSVGSLDGAGFVVPHTIPPSSRDVEPLTWSWCHGPTGTSYLFAALAHAGVTDVDGHDVRDLRARCLHAVLAAGVPHRLRPGFWDNDGRCCGTAGAGVALLDAAQAAAAAPGAGAARHARAWLDAAVLLGNALAERAIRTADAGTDPQAGLAYWRFVEHRQDPPLLPPSTSWMQGAAGIAAFLLRLARVLRDGLDAPAIDMPDSWFALPPAVRTSTASTTSTAIRTPGPTTG